MNRRTRLRVAALLNSPKDIWNYLLLAALLAPSLFWVIRDRAVWPWDQAWYGEVSVDLWFWLGHSLKGWWGEMMNGLYLKPPAIVWLGQFFVPLREIFGSVEAALLFSILMTQFLVLAILFKIGRRMAPQSRLIPVAGVLFASGSQLFVGLSHQYFVEPLQALAVAWCFYIALRAADWPQPRTAIHLASALLLGVLAKTTTPLYCLVPTLYAGYFLVRRPSQWNFRAEWKARSSRTLAIIFGFLGILCSLWYIRNLAGVWQHVRDSSSGDIALNYGTRAPVLSKLIVWSQLINPSFLSPYLGWGCFGAILIGGGFVIYRFARPSAWVGAHIEPLAVLSLIQIALLLLVFSLNITVDSRYMYALLPCVVILSMQVCMFVPRAALVALIVLGSAQWAIVNRNSLAPTIRSADQSNWLLPLQPNSSQYHELSQVVRFTTGTGESYNIVGVQKPWLNENSAAFFAAKARLDTGVRSYYTSLGYAQKDPNSAMRRIEEFRARYLITLSEQYQTNAPDFINIVSLPVLEAARLDPHFKLCTFPSANGVVVFEISSDFRASSVGTSTSTAVTNARE